MTAIIAAITAVGAIIGGVVYLVKAGVWVFKKPIDQTNQDIDAQEQKNRQEAEDSGYPV